MKTTDAETIQKANELVDQLVLTKCPTSDLFQVMAQLVRQRVPEEVCLRIWAAIETDLRACDALMCNIAINAIDFLECYQDCPLAEEYPQLAVAIGRWRLNLVSSWHDLWSIVQYVPPELEAELIQRLESIELSPLTSYSFCFSRTKDKPRLKTWLTEKLLRQQPYISTEDLIDVIRDDDIPSHWRECAAELLLLGCWRSRKRLELRFNSFCERMKRRIHGPSRADLLCVMKHIPSMRAGVWPKILDKRATWEELLGLLGFMDEDWKAVVLDRLICAGPSIPQVLALSYYDPEAALKLLRFGRLPLTDQHIFNILLGINSYPQEIIQFAWEWARPKIDQPPFSWDLIINSVFTGISIPAEEILLLIMERGNRSAALDFLCLCPEPDLAVTAWSWLMSRGEFGTPDTEKMIRMAEKALACPNILTTADELLADQATPAFMRQNIQSFKETLANLRKPTPEEEMKAKTEAILNLFSPGRK